MYKSEIILLGGGGHCRSVIDVLEMSDEFVIAGIIDRRELIGEKVLTYPIIACDDDLDAVCRQYSNFLVTVGQIKSGNIRKRLYTDVKERGGNFPVIISPKAHISKHAFIGEGTVIMHHALVNTHAKIGKNCIINSGSVVEHEVTLEDHCHISTGAILNGNCIVRNNSFIGSNSVIIQSIEVASCNVIAAGSVVIRNTLEAGLYAGNPAQFKKKTSE